MTSQPRVILYARFSTELQNAHSVRDQLDKCRAHALRQGWAVVAEFADEAMSGTRDDRPGFKDLRNAIGQGRCDIVLAESLDRFSRDQEHISRFYKEAKHNDVVLHTVDRGKVDVMQIGFSSTFSAMFLEDLREKTRRGLEGKVKDGLNAGGRAYGYRPAIDERGNPITGRLVIDENEAIIIRRIFREYAAGDSPLKIAARLNAEGIPSPRGNGAGTGGWKQNTINGNRERGTGILNNELYVGWRVWNRLRYLKTPDGNSRVSRLNPASEWQRIEVPELRILDDEQWSLAKARQDRLAKAKSKINSTDDNHLSVNRNLRRRKYLLSGLVKCGVCGGSMTVAGGTTKGSKRRYYCATNKEKGPAFCSGMPGILQSEVDGFALAGLRDGLMQPAAYAHFREEYARHLEATQSATTEDLKLRDARIREHEKTKANLMKAVETGTFSAPVLERLNQVDEELKRMKTERIEAEPKPVDLPENLPDIYREHIANLVETLTHESVAGDVGDELREMIDRVIVRHDALNGHTIELEGKIVELLQAGSSKAKGPTKGGAFAVSRSSLELVAGAGFEPAAFRL
ncbi:recombinase family protein [Paragemmobacter straminiformis]|uniref:Recombinase family protein n=1 Tax=Paragemmobacter straminiformis TaxID=2045119 RepID=A0A842IA86_9RHOB|nr:recombinase family protein [Gemmobacter straminiformis]MBC2836516.1 recombinase family protein [Gemmobacter straminiformis]